MVNAVDQLAQAGVVKQMMIQKMPASIHAALTQKTFAVEGPEDLVDGAADDLGRLHIIYGRQGPVVVYDDVIDVVDRNAQRQMIKKLAEKFQVGVLGGQLIEGEFHYMSLRQKCEVKLGACFDQQIKIETLLQPNPWRTISIKYFNHARVCFL